MTGAVGLRVFVGLAVQLGFGCPVCLAGFGGVGLVLVVAAWLVGVEVTEVTLLLVFEVTVVGLGGVKVVLVGFPVLPPVAVVVVADEPGPSEFFDTSAVKPGFVPCAKSWYQWPMLSWMPNEDVLLAGVSGGTAENAKARGFC